MATLLIATIALVGISASTVLADDPDPYMYVNWPTQGSYLDLYLDSGTTGPLAGWCAANNVFIHINHHYAYSLYDYYAGDVDALSSPEKDYVKNIDWNRIAYIMNHIVPGASVNDVQQAIWYYTNNVEPTSQNAKDMRDDAEDNGAGYVPGPEASKLMIVDMGPDVQIEFYMVPPVPVPPVPEMPPVLLLGAGVLGLGGFVWYRKRHAVAA